MKTFVVSGAAVLMSTVASAQAPQWTVEVIPTFTPLPIGACGAVHLRVRDMVARAPARNPQGYLISMADFDMTVSGAGAAGYYIDASHFSVCSCPGGVNGSTPTITATYPAQSLPAASRVPGMTIQQTATFTIGRPPQSPSNPPACAAIAAVPAGQLSPAQSPGSSQPRVSVQPTPATTAPNTPAAPRATPPGIAASPTGQPIDVQPPSRTAGSNVPAAAPPPAPVPVNPTGFTAVPGAPGEVLLTWNPVPAAAFYVVFGPGLTEGGQRVDQRSGAFYTQGTNKEAVPVFNVPGGTQEWAVASYYANNLSTAAAAFTRVSLNVPGATAAAASGPASTPAPSTPPPPAAPLSGKYLVTLTGIRCYQASMDDFLSRDGVGDEVYAATYVRRYDRRTGDLVDASVRQSASHGDVTNFSGQRLQAGTRSQTGGIHDGDMIPGPGLLATRNGLVQTNSFPMRLWEGTLTDGVDALIMSPSLWEQDVGDSFYNQWLQFEQTINGSLYAKQGVQDQIAQKQFGAVVFGMSGVDTNTSGQSIGRLVLDAGMMLGGAGVPILGLLTTTADRPIGIVQNGRDVTALPNHTVILTREIIEAALAKPALGPIPSPVANAPFSGIVAGGVPPIARIGVVSPLPGVIVVHLQEKDVTGSIAFPERPAIYQMYIQVERVP